MQPVEVANSQLTVADLFGFQYIRTGMPEYLRIIERGTLRTYGKLRHRCLHSVRPYFAP